MSLKAKRICKCCGKEYEYCPHCGSKGNDSWKNLTDTKECLAVFNIVAAYNVGRATPEQVKKVLDDNNIKDYSSFKEGIVSSLNKALDSLKPKVVKQSVVEEITPTAPHIYNIEPMNEELKIDEPIVPVVEVQSSSRKNRNGKKKYRKRNTDIEF